MAENKVSVEIQLLKDAAEKALKQLTKEIQKTEDGFETLGKKGDESMGVIAQAAQGVSGGFKSLVGGVTIANLASSAIIGTANAIKDFVLGSVNAAIEQENAINRLNQSLKASGDFSGAASNDLLNFATSMQKVSVYGDEVVVSQIAVAKSFGASNEQSKQLVQAAANLAATFGGSLESNVEKLGKTFSGSAGRLAQFIPELKNLTEEQLKNGAAFDIVNAKFGGAAANELATYQGGVTSLSNAYSDLQEELGGFVTGSTLVKDVMTSAKGLFEEATQALVDYRIEQARGGNGFIETADSVNQLSREYENVTMKIEALQTKAKGLPNGLDQFDTSKIKKYQAELLALETQVKNGAIEVDVTNKKQAAASGGKADIKPEDKAAVDSRAAARLLMEQSDIEWAAYQAEQSVLSTQITADNYAFELEQLIGIEQAKIAAKFAAEEQKATLIKDSQTSQLTLQKLGSDKELALEKSKVDSKKKLDDLALKQKQDANKATLSDENTFFSAATSLASSQNKTMAGIGIAAGLAQIARDTPPAVMSSFKFGSSIGGPVLGTIFGGIAAAAGAAQAARLSGLKFEQGGIISGNAMTGDSVQARVNSGEMILNRTQQTELFNIANGSGNGNNASTIDAINRLTSAIMAQPINVSVDGRAIATVIRKEVQSGFRIS